MEGVSRRQEENGFSTETPQPSKSPIFLVTTVSACTEAVAAMSPGVSTESTELLLQITGSAGLRHTNASA